MRSFLQGLGISLELPVSLMDEDESLLELNSMPNTPKHIREQQEQECNSKSEAKGDSKAGQGDDSPQAAQPHRTQVRRTERFGGTDQEQSQSRSSGMSHSGSRARMSRARSPSCTHCSLDKDQIKWPQLKCSFRAKGRRVAWVVAPHEAGQGN